MDPAAGLGVPLGHVGVDMLAHVGEERDDVMVGHGLDGIDLGAVERGVLADPGGLLLGDAALAELCLGFAGQDLDLLPDSVLVLQREDMAHLGARVAIDHSGSFVCVRARRYTVIVLGRIPQGSAGRALSPYRSI